MSQHKSGAAIRSGAGVGEEFPEDGIADYLRGHPDFFERHAAVLLGLKLPHRTGGVAVSLVERQVAMLRQRNGQLERQLKDLVAVAKINDGLVERIHRLAIRLMSATDVAAKLEALETSLREDFAAERAVLVLFSRAVDGAAVRDGFVRRLDRDDAILLPFATFLRAARPRCGRMRERQKAIFERDAESVSSAAMVPLGNDAGLGFLVIGSRDPEHFHPGRRMDFLSRLGDLVSVSLAGERTRRGPS